jgi:hypothetical protein
LLGYRQIDAMLGIAECLRSISEVDRRRFWHDRRSEAEAALGLPAGAHSYALLPIGYPMGRFGPVRRVALSDVVYADWWGQSGLASF